MQSVNSERSTATYKCSVCKDIGYVFRDVTADWGSVYERAFPCPNCGSGRLADDQRLRAGIPEKFYEVSLPAFQWGSYREDVADKKQQAEDFLKNFDEWRDARLGLFIWSSRRGTGKSMLASAISNSLLIKYGISLRFISVPDYLDRVKKGFARKPEEADQTRQFFDADVLVLDDFGAEKRSDWQSQELFRLIDDRYVKGKILIVTSNFAIQDLPVDTRIVDRLYEMCVQIHIPEQSVRAERADARKLEFLGHVRERAL